MMPFPAFKAYKTEYFVEYLKNKYLFYNRKKFEYNLPLDLLFDANNRIPNWPTNRKNDAKFDPAFPNIFERSHFSSTTSTFLNL